MKQMKKWVMMLAMAMLAGRGEAQFNKATLQATGLTCAMCSNAINKALQKVPAVESVRSDIKNSSFNIVFKEGVELNIDALKEAVEDAGFAIGSLKLTGSFSDVKLPAGQHVKLGNQYFHFMDAKTDVLNGENTLTVMDKDFITLKEFKKISATEKMPCLQTGVADSCCEKEGVPALARVYHVMM